MKRIPRVLIGKVGLDGHDVGARIVARALVDAGMEVVYTGLRQTPDQIVNAAIEEAVDLVGISILSGSHMFLLPEVKRLLVKKNAADIPLVAGGMIADTDIIALKKMGINAVFPPESPTEEIVSYIKSLILSEPNNV